MNIIYKSKNKTIKLKNKIFIKPIDAIQKPFIKFKFNPLKYYLLINYDENAMKGTYIHWLIVNIHGKTNDYFLNGNILLDYIGPSPPKGSGFHNYHFLLFEQSNIINFKDLKNINRSIPLIKLFKNIQSKLILKSNKSFTSKNYNGGTKKKYNGGTKKMFNYK